MKCRNNDCPIHPKCPSYSPAGELYVTPSITRDIDLFHRRRTEVVIEVVCPGMDPNYKGKSGLCRNVCCEIRYDCATFHLEGADMYIPTVMYKTNYTQSSMFAPECREVTCTKFQYKLKGPMMPPWPGTEDEFGWLK